eukprot:PhF_6_TR4161/c0_g1_i1/m.5589/K14998/SURF1, SHY1; surfeit locus 1 family protein
MRTKTSLFIFGPTAIFTFNAGLWQLYRRKWKANLIANQENSTKAPLRKLPPPGEGVPPMYQNVLLDGWIDYDSAVLVGPRSIPVSSESQSHGRSNQGSKWWGEEKGGFYLFTPFHCDDGTLVMTNLGWIPIDAFKGDIHLRKYLRTTTRQSQKLRGMIRYEETRYGYFSSKEPEIHQKPLYRAWVIFRPFETLQAILGPQTPPHPLRRYYVQMVDEDDAGRVVVHDEIFPKRASGQKHNTFSVSPNGHLMYAVFWFSVSAMSMRYVFKTMKSANRIAMIRAQQQKEMEAAAVGAQAAGAAVGTPEAVQSAPEGNKPSP